MTQALLQSVCPASVRQSQWPPMHERPIPHAFAHWPQLFGSRSVSVHPPLQKVSPPSQPEGLPDELPEEPPEEPPESDEELESAARASKCAVVASPALDVSLVDGFSVPEHWAS
jgi:hypothetical protein